MSVPPTQFIPTFFPFIFCIPPSLSLSAHPGHLNSMDKQKVNRLLTHTQSSLAHCNSAAEMHLSCLHCKGNTQTHTPQQVYFVVKAWS